LQNVEENTLKKINISEKYWNILQNVEENTLKKLNISEKCWNILQNVEKKHVEKINISEKCWNRKMLEHQPVEKKGKLAAEKE
jgi:hypothetical protein